MTILGIDPGSAICGWGVVEKNPKTNQLKLVDCGCVKTHKSSSTAERLQSVYLGIQEVINTYQPDEVAVEELFFVQNVKTGIVVGQARGVLMLAAALAGKPVFEYKPTQVKLALVGYGRADKKQVQNMVKLVLKLEKPIAQDDTADAVAVAICHLQHSNTREFSHTNHDPAGLDGLHPNTHELVPNSSPEKKKLLYPELSYEVVGALYDTFKELGPGLPEKYYYSMVARKMQDRGLQYKHQLKVNIAGLPITLGRFYVDFVIEDKIVLELKIGNRFLKKDIDQVMNYLRHSGHELGLLARFSQQGVETRRLLLGFRD